MTTASLEALQFAAWVDVTSALDGLTCAWTDIDGWHIAPLPNDEPIGATHIWGWSTERCAMIRLGGDVPIGSMLYLAPDAVTAAAGLSVEIETTTALSWVSGDKGVTIGDDQPSFEVIAVKGLMPLWFVRVP